MVGEAPNLVSEIALCLFVIIGMILFTLAVFSFAKARAKSISDISHFGHAPSNNNETVGTLSGQPLDNKLTRASNMAYSTNVNHNNNDTNLSSFNKHKSKVVFTRVPSDEHKKISPPLPSTLPHSKV